MFVWRLFRFLLLLMIGGWLFLFLHSSGNLHDLKTRMPSHSEFVARMRGLAPPADSAAAGLPGRDKFRAALDRGRGAIAKAIAPQAEKSARVPPCAELEAKGVSVPMLALNGIRETDAGQRCHN